MGLVRPDPDKVDSRYLLYAYLGSEFQEVLRRHTVQGATVERILLTEFPDFPLRVPPLPEQRRIAAVLGALDDKIELNRKMNRTLEEMAQAIFKSWFIDFDGHDDLVDSELGPIPRGWSAGTLEAVADLNPTSWSQKTHPDTVEYIDLSNTSAGQVFDVVSYAWNDAPSRARRVLEPWDTIFGCVRPANRSYALIHESGWTGSTGFAVLRGKKSAYAPFIYLAAVEDSNVARLARVADGAAYPAVRPNVVHESPVVVPDEETLIRFNEVTRPLLARIAHNDRESRTLADLRDTLLPKLISGELRVPEAEAAVGSVL